MDKYSNRFQPAGEEWESRADKSGLRSVLDPNDSRGMKNEYIDILHKTALSRHFSAANGDRVLDFGCGIGRLAPYLEKNGAEVIGIDITESMLEKARKIFPGNTFVNYDGEELPFKDGFFNAIVSVFVLQHAALQSDLNKTAKKMIRCLKPGGKVYLIEQVSREKSGYYLHRMPRDYIDAFEGCEIVSARPIRNCRSLFLSAISRGLVPGLMFPAIAHVDLFLTKDCEIPRIGYMDYLFVFKKIN